MAWRNLVAFSLLVALPMSSLGQAPPDQGVEYRLVMTCPGGAVGAGCPVTAVDGQDAMGDPSLAVDPAYPEEMILASLHGGGDSGGPSNKSRSGQAFTTFTTQNHGASWRDNPFSPPSQIGSGAYGQHPAITIDPYAHVFVGSLYAVPASNSDRGPDGRYDYVIAAQKFSDIQDINTNQGGQGDYQAEYIGSVYPGNAIRQMWFTFNRVTDNMTMVWTEQVTPHSTSGGNATRASHTLHDVLHVAREPAGGHGMRAPAGLPAPALPATRAPAEPVRGQEDAEPRSVIGVSWTEADLETEYHVQPREQAIGPCSTSTNPVISENWLYIGCRVADEGPFAWNPDAEPGDVEMFRMHPDGGQPEYIGPTPISGGMPKLGVRSDGRIALMTAEVEDGRARLDAAYGKYSPDMQRVVWGRSHQYADKLDPLPPNLDRVDLNIQDMIYREYSGVIHLILKQVVEPRDGAVARATAAVEPAIRKAIVAVDEKYGVLAEMDLDVGDPVNRSQDTTLMVQSEEVFSDISDDFLELPPGPHEHRGRPLGAFYQREYFAVADYGIVLFAEIIELTELRGPAFAPLPPPPPPPVPAAAASAAQALAPAGALVASALIAGSVATARRKSVAGAGRRKKR